MSPISHSARKRKKIKDYFREELESGYRRGAVPFVDWTRAQAILGKCMESVSEAIYELEKSTEFRK